MHTIPVEVQARTWPGVAWVWLVVVTLVWTQLYRLIGRARVNGWALSGCYRLCSFRTRVGAGHWGRWQCAYRTRDDGAHEYMAPEQEDR